MNKKYIFVAMVIAGILTGIPGKTVAQQKYWIYLNDKNTALTISLKDGLPDSVRVDGTTIIPIIYSKWLNAVSARITTEQAQILENSIAIDSIRMMSNRYVYTSQYSEQPALESYALNQIEADEIIDAGFTGKNINVGIIDAGFHRAHKVKALKPILAAERLMGYRNFIETKQEDPFEATDGHGTRVWKLIGGQLPASGTIYGLATGARYYLARTDEEPAEYRAEEDYWIAAMEWMHTKGVRIINSSLGYSDGHDNPEDDYLPHQADGKSTALTKALNIAVFEKGLLIIMSAGNSGNEEFGTINIPADSPGVIAVGSTRQKHWLKQDFSSVGRHTLPIIKPDVACYSSGGTSFSAPIIAGLAACIMEADTSLTNIEIADMIRRSGHLRYYPNNYLGYGVPNGARIMDMLNENWELIENSSQVTAQTDQVQIQLSARYPVLFHKINDWEVVDQQVIERKSDSWQITRPDASISRTTFSTRSEAIEIIWPD